MKIQKAINMIQYRIDTASKLVGNGEDGKAFEDLELAIKALKMQQRMRNYCNGSCTGCHYYNPTNGDKCMNDFIIETY